MEFIAAKNYILEKLKNELPGHLSYHSVEHIMDVYDACDRLAKEEGVQGDDRLLLLTAALYHDAGFLQQQKDHESLSCELVNEILPRFNYNPEQIKIICGMIQATRIPQDPHNKLEEILCDADLDYLGRDDFYTIGNTLFDELKWFGVLSTEEEWNRLQVRFLESHSYFTETARRLRKKKKDEHLKEVRSIIESYS
jgi:uncharacterized protein